jgi:hypothetical protein
MAKPRADPGVFTAGRVSNNVSLAKLMAVAHVVVVLLICREQWRVTHLASAPLATMPHRSMAEGPLFTVVLLLAFGLVVGWLAGGPIWLAVNGYGFVRRRPWSRRSMLAYWVVSTPLCIGFYWYWMVLLVPVCAYGIWSLTRPDVVALFSSRGA